MARYTPEEIEAFSQELALSEDSSKAYRKAKPNSKSKPESIHSLASRMAANPEVVARVKELKSQARAQAESRFSITVEQRLKWLEEIVISGLDVYVDATGSKRREGLAASRAAIQTMNEMLGTSPDDGKSARKSFNVTLRVEDASSDE
jgi:hypothetical protein